MWLLEKEIKHPENDIKLRNALKELGIEFIEIEKKSFEAISYENIKNIKFDFVYASTNIIEELKGKISGIYFNEENFNYKSWAKHYGSNLFNDPKETYVVKIKEIDLGKLNDSDDYFLRPVKDLKSFSGTVVNKKELLHFINEIKEGKYNYLDENVEVAIAPAYKIEKEWRCFMANGKVAAASQYKENGKLLISDKNLPKEMLTFAESMAKIWSPDTIFTLDIGMANQKYYIIEAQCSNSSGFYSCNMIELVKSINEAVKNERRVSRIPRF